jgi:Nucleotidyl transferase AbiEii toxin, Type IV TA system
MDKPHFSVLPEHQKLLWDQLVRHQWIEPFYLAGGTSLALHIGHRQSVDFDFFTSHNFDTREIIGKLRNLGEFELFHEAFIFLIIAFSSRHHEKNELRQCKSSNNRLLSHMNSADIPTVVLTGELIKAFTFFFGFPAQYPYFPADCHPAELMPVHLERRGHKGCSSYSCSCRCRC